MQALKVGIREFRTDLAEYIASKTPVTITRHGQTVGYFIPAQGQVEANIAALKQASKTLDELIQKHEIDIEQVVSEFKTVRKRSSQP